MVKWLYNPFFTFLYMDGSSVLINGGSYKRINVICYEVRGGEKYETKKCVYVR